jgi:hypothetical protein
MGQQARRETFIVALLLDGVHCAPDLLEPGGHLYCQRHK